MRTITCFDDWTGNTFLITALASQTDNFVNVNVFNSVTSPCALSYHCVLHYFLTMTVGSNSNVTFGLKPQVGCIKIITVCKWSIVQVEWFIATLIRRNVLVFKKWFSGTLAVKNANNINKQWKTQNPLFSSSWNRLIDWWFLVLWKCS